MIWIFAILTHDAARIAGPIWLAFGALVFVGSRITARERVLGRVTPAIGDLVPDIEGTYKRILVPMKIGLIGEEVLGTAFRLAEEQGCEVHVLHVIRVPLDMPIDAEMIDAEEQAEASLAEARLLAADEGIPIEVHIVRGRAIGEEIVREADRARGRPDRHGLGAASGGASRVSSAPRSTTSSARPLRGDGDRLSTGRSGGSPGVS